MISFEKHKKIGNFLKEFRPLLIKESIKDKSYKGTCEQKAMKALDELKNQLDNIVCRDFPDKEDKEVVTVYYGEKN